MTTAREANEAVVRAYCDAWLRGDAPAIIALYHDDIVLHYFGRSPLAGDHTGKPAAVAVLGKIQQLTNRKPVEIHDIAASADHAVMLALERWERDGRTLDVQRVFVYHVKDGKLAECWAYDDDQRAVDEFWGAP
jgi:ketosteroid isomerase-like protein